MQQINNENDNVFSKMRGIRSFPKKSSFDGIINDDLIVLYGDTIKSLLIENGEENWSATYEGLPVFQIKGGSIKAFANLLYFILSHCL